VLDVGSGSGYLTLVLAHMASRGPGARVVGVEHIGELVDGSVAAARLVPWAAGLMEEDRLRLVQ
ncbi:Protein-L-isoaspartate(D-aspartate) O-methyltransferase, partial [Tetrabaena socialis]